MVRDLRPPAPDDYDAWVARLADSARAVDAFRHLVRSGSAALPAIRRGANASSADVRYHCARALDRLVDVDSYSILVELLRDEEPRVRCEALHALACDRCKADGCRPTSSVLDPAIDVLRHDPASRVRGYACEVVGRWAHTHPTAAEALLWTRDHDPHPMVRKKASWYAPDGTIYRKRAQLKPTVRISSPVTASRNKTARVATGPAGAVTPGRGEVVAGPGSGNRPSMTTAHTVAIR